MKESRRSLLFLAALPAAFIPDVLSPPDDSPPPVTRVESQVDKTRRTLKETSNIINAREPQAVRLVLTASFQIKNDYSFIDRVFQAHLTNEYL